MRRILFLHSFCRSLVPAGLVLLQLFGSPLLAQEEQPIPAMTGWVVDTTGTLSRQEVSELSTKLEAFQKKHGSQLAVVIVPTVKPETIEQYCLRVAEKWKVGQKDKDNGVVLCIAKEDRRVRIEVGYGVEGLIPDARAKQIIEDVIVPNFKAGHFYQGIDEGIQAITLLLSGKNLEITRPEDTTDSNESEEDDEEDFYGLMIFFGIIAFILHIFVPNRYLIGVGSVGGGLSFLFSVFIIGFFQALAVGGVFFLVVMFGMQILWAMLSSSGGGGRSGSYSGGGSSFSGGGGGSFGGGGASGSW